MLSSSFTGSLIRKSSGVCGVDYTLGLQAHHGAGVHVGCRVLCVLGEDK